MATVGYITEDDAVAHVHKIALDKGAPFNAEDQAFNVEAAVREDTILAADGSVLAQGAKGSVPARLHGVDLEEMMDDAGS